MADPIPESGAASPPLKVLVDGASASTGGGATYLSSQLAALAHRGDISLTVYAKGSVAYTLEANGLPLEVRRAPSFPVILRLLWEQLVLPVQSSAFDVVYMPGNFALFASRRPQVVAFQNPNHFGSTARRIRRQFFDRRSRLRLSVESLVARMSIRRATIPVAISQTLRRTIEEDLGELERLQVIYSAMPEKVATVEHDFFAERYVLTVANDYPHKDWDGLIAAFSSRDDLPRLKIVGRCRSTKRSSELARRLHAGGLNGRIELVGVVDDRMVIHSLYSSAACFVAHSHLEAFPLTPYEAMSHGVPVVASDIPSHREICGQYATYYPPARRDLLADAVYRALSERSSVRERPVLATRTWADHGDEFAGVLLAAAREGTDRDT